MLGHASSLVPKGKWSFVNALYRVARITCKNSTTSRLLGTSLHQGLHQTLPNKAQATSDHTLLGDLGTQGAGVVQDPGVSSTRHNLDGPKRWGH